MTEPDHNEQPQNFKVEGLVARKGREVRLLSAASRIQSNGYTPAEP
jgi:hypothetical protein